MPKVFIFVKQHDSDLPPVSMLDVTDRMAMDDIMVCLDTTKPDLAPFVAGKDGPMDHVVTYEDD